MPLSVFWGLYFALLAFCSIWCISPCIKGFIIWVSQKPIWKLIRYRSGAGPISVQDQCEPKTYFFLDNFHQQDLGINDQNVLGSIVWIIRLNFHKDSSDAENAVSTTSKDFLWNIHFETLTSKHTLRIKCIVFQVKYMLPSVFLCFEVDLNVWKFSSFITLVFGRGKTF